VGGARGREGDVPVNFQLERTWDSRRNKNDRVAASGFIKVSPRHAINSQ
jgi:hypothetical protein